jgi:hypothetical protein
MGRKLKSLEAEMKSPEQSLFKMSQQKLSGEFTASVKPILPRLQDLYKAYNNGAHNPRNP